MPLAPAEEIVLLEKAGDILSRSAGQIVKPTSAEILKDTARSLVVRAAITSPSLDLQSVIIRKMKAAPSCAFSDWAGTCFLSQIPTTRTCAPRFLGGDAESGIFLSEDLGPGERLQDILEHGNADKVHEALMNLGEVMAQMHASTFGLEDIYQNLRQSLPHHENLGRHVETQRWNEGCRKLVQWLDALDCATPGSFDESLNVLAATFREPGEFLAFSHGDPAPTNNYFAAGRAYLLDFEYAAYRHVLYDITAWAILCPLPENTVREMALKFRQELARTFSPFQDEELFARHWAYLCAYRALAILTWIPPGIIAQNRPWADNWTMREAVLVATSRLSRIASSQAELAPIAQAADEMVNAMLHHWPEYTNPEDQIPNWPAFQNL